MAGWTYALHCAGAHCARLLAVGTLVLVEAIGLGRGVAWAQAAPPAPPAAQTQAPALTQAQLDTLTFEVASVKPNVTPDGPAGFQMMPGGQLRIMRLSLKDLLWMAYGAGVLQTRDQLTGGPDWLGIDRFDIVAKAEHPFVFGANGPPKEFLAMLRNLLADRFQVKVHEETREMPTYRLVANAKDRQLGPRIHPATVACPKPGEPIRDIADFCGVRNTGLGAQGGSTAGHGVTMAMLADNLSHFPAIGRPVHDATGIDGAYDFTMEFVPIVLWSGPDGRTASNALADTGANIFTALKEQLGLKLEGDKAPVTLVVIDRAEHPVAD